MAGYLTRSGRALIALLALLPALSFAPAATAASPALAALPTRWQDDAGTRWQRPSPLPSRWIVLGPQLVDMVTRLGAGARIVGVQDDHPLPGRYRVSLSGYPVVGQASQISLEYLRRQHPDLVIYWAGGLPAPQVEHLRALGLPLLAIGPATLRDIPQRLRWLGALSGREAEADALADHLLGSLDRLEQAEVGRRRLKGFYQVWMHPLYSLSPRNLVSQALRVCGVDVIVPDTPVQAPVISREYVVRARPEVILVAPEQLAEAQREWGRFPELPAVQHHAIVAVDDRALTRPGLSLLEAMPALCRQMSAWQAP